MAGNLQGVLPSPDFESKSFPQESPFKRDAGYGQLWAVWSTDNPHSSLHRNSQWQASQSPRWNSSWQTYQTPSWTSIRSPAANGLIYRHPTRTHDTKPYSCAPFSGMGNNAFQMASEFQSRKSFAHKSFCCDSCNKAYAEKWQLDEHLAEHVKCDVGICNFKAHPKIVALHKRMHHDSGIAKKIMNLDTPEDIMKWRAERRKNFPTAANIARRKAEAAEKQARGEVLETKEFGKIRRPLFRGRGRFRMRGRWRNSYLASSNKPLLQNDSHESTQDQHSAVRGGNMRWNRYRCRGKLRSTCSTEPVTPKTFTNQNIKTHDEDGKRALMPFRGTLHNYEVDSDPCNDVCLSVLEEICNSVSSENGFHCVTSGEISSLPDDVDMKNYHEDHETLNENSEEKFAKTNKEANQHNDLDDSQNENRSVKNMQDKDLITNLIQDDEGMLEDLDGQNSCNNSDNIGSSNSDIAEVEVATCGFEPLKGEDDGEITCANDNGMSLTEKITGETSHRSDEKEEGELTSSDDDDVASVLGNGVNGAQKLAKATEKCSSVQANFDIEDLDEPDSAPLSLPASKAVSSSKPLHSQLGGSLGLLMSSYGNPDSDSEGEIHSDEEHVSKQVEKCKTVIKKHVNSFPINKKRSTLLEKLLAKEIRHERNVILQCVRYIMKKDFFKIE